MPLFESDRRKVIFVVLHSATITDAVVTDKYISCVFNNLIFCGIFSLASVEDHEMLFKSVGVLLNGKECVNLNICSSYWRIGCFCRNLKYMCV